MSKRNVLVVAAAGLIGLALLAASGFQGQPDKFAVVDMNRLMNDSKRGAKVRDSLQSDFRQRAGILDFLNTNDVATQEQANQLKQLTLKDNPTDADKGSVEKIKDDIKKAVKEFNDLNVKSNPTDTDRNRMVELNGLRSAIKEKIIPQMQKDFDDEFNAEKSKMQNDLLEAAKAAVKDVAGKKGVTMVFESSVVMFSANDLTDDAIKSMNAKA